MHAHGLVVREPRTALHVLYAAAMLPHVFSHQLSPMINLLSWCNKCNKCAQATLFAQLIPIGGYPLPLPALLSPATPGGIGQARLSGYGHGPGVSPESGVDNWDLQSIASSESSTSSSRAASFSGTGDMAGAGFGAKTGATRAGARPSSLPGAASVGAGTGGASSGGSGYGHAGHAAELQPPGSPSMPPLEVGSSAASTPRTMPATPVRSSGVPGAGPAPMHSTGPSPALHSPGMPTLEPGSVEASPLLDTSRSMPQLEAADSVASSAALLPVVEGEGLGHAPDPGPGPGRQAAGSTAAGPAPAAGFSTTPYGQKTAGKVKEEGAQEELSFHTPPPARLGQATGAPGTKGKEDPLLQMAARILSARKMGTPGFGPGGQAEGVGSTGMGASAGDAAAAATGAAGAGAMAAEPAAPGAGAGTATGSSSSVEGGITLVPGLGLSGAQGAVALMARPPALGSNTSGLTTEEGSGYQVQSGEACRCWSYDSVSRRGTGRDALQVHLCH